MKDDREKGDVGWRARRKKEGGNDARSGSYEPALGCDGQVARLPPRCVGRMAVGDARGRSEGASCTGDFRYYCRPFVLAMNIVMDMRIRDREKIQ
jgi:hypothetical protein